MSRPVGTRRGRRALALAALALAALAVAVVVVWGLGRLLTAGDAVLLGAVVVALALVGLLIVALPALDRLPPRPTYAAPRQRRRRELVRRREAGPHAPTHADAVRR